MQVKAKALPGVQKEIILLAVLIWPDHAQPRGTASVLGLIILVNKFKSRGFNGFEPKDPHRVLIHCCVGVGRTGTFIAVLFAMKILKTSSAPSETSAPKSVSERIQFCFFLECVHTHLLANKEISAANLADFKSKSARILK